MSPRVQLTQVLIHLAGMCLDAARMVMGASYVELASFDATVHPEVDAVPRYRVDNGDWVDLPRKKSTPAQP